MCINEVQEVEEKLGRSSVGRGKHLRTFFRIMQEFSRSRKLNESQAGFLKKFPCRWVKLQKKEKINSS